MSRDLSRSTSSIVEETQHIIDKLQEVRDAAFLVSARPDEILEGVISLDEFQDPQIVSEPPPPSLSHPQPQPPNEQKNNQNLIDIDRFTAKKILFRDKLAFVLGIIIVWISAYQLGTDKQQFYKLYIFLAIVLFGARFVSYRMARTHYYMFDLCYFANLWMVIVLWRFPNLNLLMKIMYAYNTGPMAWSILAMRNSLVLHSMDKLITLFMHWYPMVVSWTQRWYPEDGVDPTSQTATIFELGILPLVPYIAWLIFYYLKLFVFSADKIQQKGYDTVYHWMLKSKNHPVSKLVLKYKQWQQPIVYLGVHGVLCWIAFLLTYFFYHSYWAHTIFLILLSLDATWNGANYYFEVFAHRYIVGLGLDLKPPKKGK